MIRFFSATFSLYFILSSCSSLKKRAQRHEVKKEFWEASQLYQKLYNKTPHHKKKERGYWAYRVAQCNHKLRNFHKAYHFYKQAELCNYNETSLLYKTAYCLHSLGKYEEAKKYYEACIKNTPQSTLAQIGLSGVSLGMTASSPLPTAYELRPISGRLSAYNEAEIYVHPKEWILYFSRYKHGKDKRKENQVYLYSWDYKTDGTWGESPRLTKLITIPKHWGIESFSITQDGSRAYFILTNQSKRNLFTSKYDWGLKTWEQPQIIEGFPISHEIIKDIRVNESGNRLYVSIADSLNQTDIYSIDIQDGGHFQPPHKLPFNTPGDDMSPYPVGDSLLYFSSDGYPSYGGLDLHLAKRHLDGTWSIQHLPQPLNSSADDLSIASITNNQGVIVSTRNNPRGQSNLYTYTRIIPSAKIDGLVVDSEGNPINQVLVRMVERFGTNYEQSTLSLPNGVFSFNLDIPNQYTLHASKDGYFSQYAELKTEPSDLHETFLVDFKLSSKQRIEKLSDVTYAFGSYELSNASKLALEELFRVLVDNPEAQILLSSHTDRIGNKRYNQQLSLKRAQSAKNYLVHLGVSKDRIRIKGYGSDEPYIIKEIDVRFYPFLRPGDKLDDIFISSLKNEKEKAICDSLNRRTTFRYINR